MCLGQQVYLLPMEGLAASSGLRPALGQGELLCRPAPLTLWGQHFISLDLYAPPSLSQSGAEAELPISYLAGTRIDPVWEWQPAPHPHLQVEEWPFYPGSEIKGPAEPELAGCQALHGGGAAQTPPWPASGNSQRGRGGPDPVLGSLPKAGAAGDAGLPAVPSRCPSRGDNYQARLVPLQGDAGLPFPSHHQRFVVATFAFVGTDSRRMLSGPVGLGGWPGWGLPGRAPILFLTPEQSGMRSPPVLSSNSEQPILDSVPLSQGGFLYILRGTVSLPEP